jgi:hypothetical protein
MDIPIAPPLADIIAATPMIGVKTFLVTDYGKPFTPAGFGNWFRERCNEAGLAALLGARPTEGLSTPHGRGWMQRRLHRQHQRPPRLSRDQDLRTGRQQSTYGYGRNGASVGDVSREK